MWAGISQVAKQATKQCPLPLHEALALTVPQNATLSARPLCDEAPSSVDACGMELHKLQVLHKQHCLIACYDSIASGPQTSLWCCRHVS